MKQDIFYQMQSNLIRRSIARIKARKLTGCSTCQKNKSKNNNIIKNID